VWLTVAVSPAPGTPAPPQVEALLQFPFWELVKVAANSGIAAKRVNTSNAKRAPKRLMLGLRKAENVILPQALKITRLRTAGVVPGQLEARRRGRP
jgi:hypothetical protein